jgi:hypothetical protein
MINVFLSGWCAAALRRSTWITHETYVSDVKLKSIQHHSSIGQNPQALAKRKTMLPYVLWLPTNIDNHIINLLNQIK